MEEDEYYLDRYDYQPQTSVSSTCASVSTSARQDSLGPGPDEEVEIDGVDYEDDYDHLYVDTDGAEQYLREIWSQLGVGYNGYLNLAELYRVCEHIGMSASEEMIEQLFDKLDNDQDGRVSFGEFADGLFKYVHKTTRTAPAATTTAAAAYSSPSHVPSAADPSDPVTSTSQYLDKQTLSPSEHNHPPTFHRFISTFTNFLTINTDKDGYVACLFPVRGRGIQNIHRMSIYTITLCVVVVVVDFRFSAASSCFVHQQWPSIGMEQPVVDLHDQ